MKNVKLVVAVAFLTSAMAFAQRNGHRGHRAEFHKDLSVEQLATLQTKKMTLALDLSEKQQKDILEFNIANAEFRKAKMAEREAKRASEERSKPSADERFAMQNEKLDHRIAQQQELKKILTDEQFDLWKKMQLHRHGHKKRNGQKEGRRG
jgi:parvulin-like peptidyl-prolyl isomerase